MSMWVSMSNQYQAIDPDPSLLDEIALDSHLHEAIYTLHLPCLSRSFFVGSAGIEGGGLCVQCEQCWRTSQRSRCHTKCTFSVLRGGEWPGNTTSPCSEGCETTCTPLPILMLPILTYTFSRSHWICKCPRGIAGAFVRQWAQKLQPASFTKHRMLSCWQNCHTSDWKVWISRGCWREHLAVDFTSRAFVATRTEIQDISLKSILPSVSVLWFYIIWMPF